MTATGTLFIVATPIGSLKDLSPQACRILAEVDVILAEDTRRTRALLSHFEIRAGRRLRSFRDHNEGRVMPQVMAALHKGESIALVSDAGTPVLSDPGFELIRSARQEGIAVASVPGASAFTAALAASGQPPLPATLAGFLPARGKVRRRRLADLAELDWSIVFFVSPHRLRKDLEELAEHLGPARPATLLAELSKVHERAWMGELGELVRSSDAAEPRGEYVLVVGPRDPELEPRVAVESSDVEMAYQRLIADGATRREAIRETSRQLGLSRNEVYAALVELRRKTS